MATRLEPKRHAKELYDRPDLFHGILSSDDGEEDVVIPGNNEYEAERILAQKTNRNGELLYLIKWKGHDQPQGHTWEPKDNISSRELLRDWRLTKRKQQRGTVLSFDLERWEGQVQEAKATAGIIDREMLSRLDRKEDNSLQTRQARRGSDYAVFYSSQGVGTVEEVDRRTTAQSSGYWSVPETTDFPMLLGHFGTDWHGIARFMTTKTHIMVSQTSSTSSLG